MSRNSLEYQFFASTPLSDVFAEAFNQLYKEKPLFPVKYLANWLLNYSKKQQALKAKQKENSRLKLQAQQRRKVSEKGQKAVRTKQQQQLNKEKRLKAFKEAMAANTNPEELISFQYPEFLQKYFNLTGVYICLIHSPLEDSNNDSAPPADQPKQLVFIGSSKSHEFMVGNQLSQESVTFQFLKQFRVPEEPVEEGQEPPKKERYLYIPNVLKNEKISYFKIPKLGSYMAVPMIVKSYLQIHSLEEGIEERKRFLSGLEDYRKARDLKIAEVMNQINELQERQHKNSNLEQVSSASQQLQQARNKLQQLKSEADEPKENSFEFKQLELIICCDVLGQDREILQQQRQGIVALVESLRDSWESTQMRLLSSDIDRQLYYLSKNFGQYSETLNNLEERESDEKAREIKDRQSKDATELQQNFEMDFAKLAKIRQHLFDAKIQEAFKILCEFRIIKYSKVIQLAAYFVGYDPAKVNNRFGELNWVTMRTKLKDIIQKMSEYEVRGEKKEKLPPHRRVNFLLDEKAKPVGHRQLQHLHGKNPEILGVRAAPSQDEREHQEGQLRALPVLEGQDH